MTIAEIDDILTGTFESESDRNYWVKKREELIQKEKRARNNEEYFRTNKKYDR